MPTVERKLVRCEQLQKDVEPAEKLIKKINKEYRKVQKRIDNDAGDEGRADELNDTSLITGRKKLLSLMKSESRGHSMRLLEKYDK